VNGKDHGGMDGERIGDLVLVGRDAESAAIGAFVADGGRGPCALVLAGDAGIGKTALWRAGVETARQRDRCVLTCRGVEAEASLSFAGLSELLEPVLDEVAPLLASPRRRALEVALSLADPGDAAPDAHAIGLALLDVFGALARQAPVVVAVDDVQWLDPASAAVLQIALRRLRGQPVSVLMTVREAADLSVPIQLDRYFDAGRLERLVVGPLTVGALHRLLKERVGLDLSRPELVSLHEVSMGNPFFAVELGREFARTNARPTAAAVVRLPASLHELLGDRLARLPSDAGDVLLELAALARPTVEVIALAHGDERRVLEALDAAVTAGVIEVEEGRVRFTHPLHASLCYQQAPLWKRRAVHQALAAAVTDVEERARHLALAVEGADAAVANELEVAARHAADRGATAAGAELFELAAGFDPADAEASRRRRLQAARLHRLAGATERAVSVLKELLTEVAAGLERADLLLELTMTFPGTSAERAKLCDEALVHAAGDPAREARILIYSSGLRIWVRDVRAGLRDARAALQRAERVGVPRLLAAAISRVGLAETYAAELTPGILERGVELEQSLGLELEYWESPRYEYSRLLARSGDIERPLEMLQQLAEAADTRGDEVSKMMCLWMLSQLEWLAGQWSLALDHAVEASQLTDQTQSTHGRGWVGRVKGLIEADLGLVEQARLSAGESLALGERAGEHYTIHALGVLGRIELALGNLEAAGRHLRDLPARLLAAGMLDPMTVVWADAIETLTALGELNQAGVYLEQYETSAKRVKIPWAVAAASRCRGLLAARRGDQQDAVVAIEQALIDLDGCGYPFERGRTLLALGTVRRQAQEKAPARAALEQAVAIFEQLGAPLWAAKTDNELARISGRRPAPQQLTATEHQVAVLAAQGHSNKEIAATLHMGVSTVEAHLSAAYRKTGVRRARLGAWLASRADEANPVDIAAQT
jgi:DNA-binding CsgD family transcriptional regulator